MREVVVDRITVGYRKEVCTCEGDVFVLVSR